MASSSRSEEDVKQWLQELQKQLVKKQAFEQAVSEIRALVLDVYPSSSPSLRKLFYSVICRVATVLQARYTSPGFWLAGLRLFEDSERLVAGTKEKEHLKACIARVHEHMREAENEGLDSASNNIGNDNRYFFEGHLTMGPEPPPPAWLVAQNLLTTFAAAQGNLGTTEASHNVGSNDGSNSTSMPTATSEMLEHLISSMQEHSGFQDLDNVLEASLQEIGAGPKMPPPASKEVVANLPVITVTDEVLARLGSETECAVCRETLVVNDKMQELPCKHLYHPPCLKPWLDEHNSCPVCRHELQTDDHAYESWKEREKEAEEERKGAANAVRGGEHMYI